MNRQKIKRVPKLLLLPHVVAARRPSLGKRDIDAALPPGNHEPPPDID